MSTEPRERLTGLLSLLLPMWAMMAQAQSFRWHISASLARVGRVSFARHISTPAPRKAWKGSKMTSLAWMD